MDLIARHMNSTENMQAESNGLPNIAPAAAAFQMSGNFLSTVSIIYVCIHMPIHIQVHVGEAIIMHLIENESIPFRLIVIRG